MTPQELQNKIDAATTRMLALQKERQDREASANAHESQAREDRKAMTAIKIEMAELDSVLRHSQVQKTVEDSAALQRKATAEAESVLARVQKQEATLAELIAKQVERDQAAQREAVAKKDEAKSEKTE